MGQKSTRIVYATCKRFEHNININWNNRSCHVQSDRPQRQVIGLCLVNILLYQQNMAVILVECVKESLRN